MVPSSENIRWLQGFNLGTHYDPFNKATANMQIDSISNIQIHWTQYPLTIDNIHRIYISSVDIIYGLDFRTRIWSLSQGGPKFEYQDPTTFDRPNLDAIPLVWAFPKMGIPRKIINFHRMFHDFQLHTIHLWGIFQTFPDIFHKWRSPKCKPSIPNISRHVPDIFYKSSISKCNSHAIPTPSMVWGYPI